MVIAAFVFVIIITFSVTSLLSILSILSLLSIPSIPSIPSLPPILPLRRAIVYSVYDFFNLAIVDIWQYLAEVVKYAFS